MKNADKTICVVDDDLPICKALRRLIKSAGFGVITYTSAQDFLNAGAAEESDVLILDVRMPGMTGFDLQEQLANGGYKIPFVFMTAHENGEARSRAIKAGAVAFLQKPFSDQELLGAIDAGIKQRGD